MTLFDFDNIRDWGPRLGVAADGLVPPVLREQLSASKFECYDDAHSFLVSRVDEDRLAARCSDWLWRQSIAAYHGSRLSFAELLDLRNNGLRPLDMSARKRELRSRLSADPRWPDVECRLDDVVERALAGEFGTRQGQVHATISRSLLFKGASHYLLNGSEADSRIAHELLGAAGRVLLRQGRTPTLVSLNIPGRRAREVAERSMTSETSGLVRHILRHWAAWLAHPEIDLGAQRVDYGFIFYSAVPASWIGAIEPIDEVLLPAQANGRGAPGRL